MSAFAGDFDLLPLRSSFDNGPVPYAPTSDDFHLAVSRLRGAEMDADDNHCSTITWRVAASRWFVEAIRERRANTGADLNSNAIMQRTSAALYEWGVLGHRGRVPQARRTLNGAV